MDSYLSQSQRSAAYESWLQRQADLPSFAALSHAAFPSAASLFSLHRRAIRRSPASSFAAVFFAQFLRGFETPAVRIQAFFYAAMETLLQSQSHLFLRSSILSVMQRGMQSPYITVREKNLRLLLSASSFYPRLLGPYAPVIQQGLEDRGVSVRRISSRLARGLLEQVLKELDVVPCETVVKLVGWMAERAFREEDAKVREACEANVLRVLLGAGTLGVVAQSCVQLQNQMKEQSESSVTRFVEECRAILEQSQQQAALQRQIRRLFDTFFEADTQVSTVSLIERVVGSAGDPVDLLAAQSAVARFVSLRVSLHARRSLVSNGPNSRGETALLGRVLPHSRPREADSAVLLAESVRESFSAVFTDDREAGDGD